MTGDRISSVRDNFLKKQLAFEVIFRGGYDVVWLVNMTIQQELFNDIQTLLPC